MTPRAFAARNAKVPPGSPLARLYAMKLRTLWRTFRSQPASFWLISLYLMLEYVRPQSIYGPIKGWPLDKVAVILCAVALLVEQPKFRKLGLADGLLALYCLVVLASSLQAQYPGQSFDAFNDFFTWVAIYLLITNIVVTEKRFLLFWLLYLLFCLKMSQHGVRGWASVGFGFRTWGVTCAPGFFQNSGECGIQMTMFFPMGLFFFLALRQYWGRWKKAFFILMPVTAAMTIVGSSSRGAVLGLAAVGLWWAMMASRNRVKTLLKVAVLAAAIYAVIPATQKHRFDMMGHDKDSISRLTYWRRGIEMMEQYPILGIGYANWLPYYFDHYDPNGQLPHNIFIQAGSELGLLGLMAFLALIGATVVINRRTRRMMRRLGPEGVFLSYMAYGLDGALVGFLVSGFFVTVLYYPFFWINLALTVSLNETAKRKLQARARSRPALAPRSEDGMPVLAGVGGSALRPPDVKT